MQKQKKGEGILRTREQGIVKKTFCAFIVFFLRERIQQRIKQEIHNITGKDISDHAI